VFEFLFVIDLRLLKLLNQTLQSEFLDAVAPTLTDLHKNQAFVWTTLPLMLVFSIWRWGWKKATFFLVWVALCLSVSDAFSGQVLKPSFGRDRPDVGGAEVVLRCPHFSGGSFPSNHSANTAVLVGISAVFKPLLLWLTAPLAFLSGYLRVYCGVHYPSDVFAGWMYGLLVGLLLSRLARPLHRKFFGTSI
jgi:undecaprenyl-diphosphatase